MNDQYFLMWSQANNRLRVAEVEHVLSKNRQAYGDDRKPTTDEIPIAVGRKVDMDNSMKLMGQTLERRSRGDITGALRFGARPVPEGAP